VWRSTLTRERYFPCHSGVKALRSLAVADSIRRVHAGDAPAPLGAYPHATVARGIVYCSGQGARDPATGAIAGLVRDASGAVVGYDMHVGAEACLGNVRRVLEAAGSSLDRLVELNVFLRDMAHFDALNEVYGRWFADGGPARTTIGVHSLPAGNFIEIRAVALAPGEDGRADA
jgi:2-aminomuconate deaminase